MRRRKTNEVFYLFNWSSFYDFQAIEEETDRYLSDDRTENKMFDSYAHVREVYIKFNTTLAFSAVVQRVFSQSALIFTPRRNRLLSVNFEYALILKFNRKIFSTNMYNKMIKFVK